MIDIAKLTKKDVGRWVVYTAAGGEKVERGRIKIWNSEFIFVVYHCGDEWHRYQDFTGAATKPENLEFAK